MWSLAGIAKANKVQKKTTDLQPGDIVFFANSLVDRVISIQIDKPPSVTVRVEVDRLYPTYAKTHWWAGTESYQLVEVQDGSDNGRREGIPVAGAEPGTVS